jgi:hypothetical protein
MFAFLSPGLRGAGTFAANNRAFVGNGRGLSASMIALCAGQLRVALAVDLRLADHAHEVGA